MKKLLLAGVAAAALALAGSPAFALTWGAGAAGVGGQFNMNSSANSGGSTWGQGTVTQRYNWSGTATNNSGELKFDGSYNSNSGGVVKAGANFDSQAAAGNGGYIETHGANASYTGSHSASNASGSFAGGMAGGFIAGSGH